MRNRVREWRETRGLTQEALAEMLGKKTHVTTLSRIENGHLALNERWIIRLSKALEVHPADLIGDDVEGPPPHRLQHQEEASLYLPPENHWLSSTSFAKNQFPYQIKSNALDAYGIPAGAVVIADFDAENVTDAKEANATLPVLIKLHYDEDDYAKILLAPRLFIPPRILIRNSNDFRIDPMVLDDTRMEIVAIITSTIRDT